MKFDENYITLLAGLVDDDDLEDVRHKVRDQVQENKEQDMKEVSDKVTLLEYIGFREEPYEGVEDLDREKATAANAQPKATVEDSDEGDGKGAQSGDWKYYTPDHTVRKVMDMEDGKKPRPLPTTSKWKSNTIAVESAFVDKYTLEECGCDAGMNVPVRIPQEVLMVLSTVQNPGLATNVVATAGADGVPMSYVKKAVEELHADPDSEEAFMELSNLIGHSPIEVEDMQMYDEPEMPQQMQEPAEDPDYDMDIVSNWEIEGL